MKTSEFTIPFTIHRNGTDIPVDVTFYHEPPSRGVSDSLGCPESPDEPEVLEFVSATIGCIEVDLTEEEKKRAEQAAWDFLYETTAGLGEEL